MTKQEFAIKLLFWLMPWPLSKAFPGLVLHILTGPAAETPLQWAQATYDALAKQLSDATTYAQTFMATIADITPTDQLIQGEAALTAAIQNATSLMRDLAEIMANLEDFTPDQISQAFQDAVSAMEDITSSTDALINAIEQIPPEDRPEIPPPEYIPPEEVPEIPPIVEIPPEEIPPGELPGIPPPEPVPPEQIPPPVYIPPFPSIYAPVPGPGLYSSFFLNRKRRAQPQWVERFDNTHWEGYDDSYVWDGTKWVADDSVYSPWLVPIGTWHHGFRPTHIRVTFSPSPGRLQVTDDSPANYALYTSSTYISVAEAPLNWEIHDPIGDIGRLWIRYQTWYATIVTNIEFLEE